MAVQDDYVSMSAASAQKFNKRLRAGDVAGTWDDDDGRLDKAPILVYPSDIGTNPHQASYILFTGYSITKAKLKPLMKSIDVFKKGEKNLPVDVVRARKAAAASVSVLRSTERRLAEMAKSANSSSSSSALTLARRNFPQSGTVIGLYMPPAVNVSYSMDYESAPMGPVGEMIGSIIKDIATRAGITNILTNAGDIAKTGAAKSAIGIVDAVVPGVKDLLAIETGVIITPRTELMFRGIGRREFSFTFTFIPKDHTESKTVHAIIQKFKEGMSPTFNQAATTRELTIPDVFQIDYMHITGPNSYLNKIGRCYLQKMDVTYGGDKFVTYDHGGANPPPQKTVITLAFKELEVMDRTKIEDGF